MNEELTYTTKGEDEWRGNPELLKKDTGPHMIFVQPDMLEWVTRFLLDVETNGVKG